MINRRRVIGAGLGLAAASGIGRAAWAQSSTPIRLVVPYGPGGSTDTAARLLAEKMAEDLKTTIVVENKPGGGTMVGMQNVAGSKPDGKSLLLMTTTAALLPAFDRPMPIHPQKDLVTVSQLADIPCLFAVNAKNPATNWAEFTDWLKKQPGEVHYSTSSSGGLPHLWGELISAKTGAKLKHLPYKAAAEALRDAVAGHVPAFVDVTTPIDQQIRAGTMKGLMVGSPSRVSAVPDVPTVHELGMPDLQAAVYFGVAAPAGTPAELIERYNTAINAALKIDVVREKYQTLGFIPTGGTPQAYADRLAAETVRWRKVIKDANIEAPI